MAKAEPLYLKNNIVKEHFMYLCQISRMFVLQICELHQGNQEL